MQVGSTKRCSSAPNWLELAASLCCAAAPELIMIVANRWENVTLPLANDKLAEYGDQRSRGVIGARRISSQRPLLPRHDLPHMLA